MDNQIIEHLQEICGDDFGIDVSGDVFRKCAEFLMNKCVLLTKEKRYRFVELEFYKYSLSHSDEYCHQEKPQLELGKWYFHWSGIDITFGAKDIFGGILIRGVKEELKNGYTNGPLNVMREVMSHFGNVTEPSQILKIEQHSDLKTSIIYNSQRIGLPIENFTDAEKFRGAKYRFIADIKEPKHGYKEKEKVKALNK